MWSKFYFSYVLAMRIWMNYLTTLSSLSYFKAIKVIMKIKWQNICHELSAYHMIRPQLSLTFINIMVIFRILISSGYTFGEGKCLRQQLLNECV